MQDFLLDLYRRANHSHCMHDLLQILQEIDDLDEKDECGGSRLQ